VRASDFDRVTSERDALQTSLDAVTFNLDKTDKVVLALHQRLTAADERNDEAIDLLRRARAVIAGGGWADLERDIASFMNNKSALMPAETVAGHHSACRAVDDYKPDDCSHGCKPATQPQGEPVEYQSRTRPLWRAEDGERAWFPWEKCSAESFANYQKNPFINEWQYEVRALYAEQPARVTVALPDRKVVSASGTKAARQADLINGANYYTAAELAAEAVIDEVTPLNTK